MLRLLKWFGIVVGGLVGVIAILILTLYIVGTVRLGKTYDVQPAAVAVPKGDAAAFARGKHVAEAFALCTECHKADLSGQVLADDPAFGRLAPRNLTSGKGGLSADYGDVDMVRAIRHGIGKDGKAIPIMPSDLYNQLSEADTGALIAYIRSIPPVDNEVPKSNLGPMGRILLATGQLKGFFPATEIDHTAARPPEPQPGVTREYGAYLGIVCTACHQKDLAGGPIPGAPPGSLPAPPIHSGAAPGRWTEAQFINTLRTGTTPEGRQLDGEQMPWPALSKMTDDELKAVYLYLKTMPPPS